MSTPRTIAFHTLGCKLNFSETSSIAKLFHRAGFEEVDFSDSADYYIINTCSVTDQADKKCRKVIRKALSQNSMAKVVVMGCYAQLKPQEIAGIPGVSLVLGAKEKFNILQYIEKLERHQTFPILQAGPVIDIAEFVPSFSVEDRTRSFLKVQDGCDYKCSFCTIPQARGKSRSGSIAQIVAAAKEIADTGVKEIVLTGVNIGDYGNGPRGINGKTTKKEGTLLDLLKVLDTIDSQLRIRISSIEPNLCTDAIIEFVASSQSIMPHFHMPLQSGDNHILAAMKRRYKRELYENRVNKIKELMPHACIGTDVIVGFPGETTQHFHNTYRFINDLPVSYLHCFTYSERANTLAAAMAEKVEPEHKHERSLQLRILSNKKKRAFYEAHFGDVRPVLYESANDSETIEGYTDNYIKVVCPLGTHKANQIERVRLNNLKEDYYLAS